MSRGTIYDRIIVRDCGERSLPNPVHTELPAAGIPEPLAALID